MMMEVWAPIDPDGLASSCIVSVSASVIFPSYHKTQKMVCNNTIVGYHPMGTNMCLCKQEVWKRSQNAANLCAKTNGCVHEDMRIHKLQKGWGFRVGTWNVDSLTGRADELIEDTDRHRSSCGTHIKKHNREKGVAGYFGAKDQKYKLFWIGQQLGEEMYGV